MTDQTLDKQDNQTALDQPIETSEEFDTQIDLGNQKQSGESITVSDSEIQSPSPDQSDHDQIGGTETVADLATDQLNESSEESIAQKTSTLPTVQEEDDGSRWYVIHTYSGHENKVAQTLKQRIVSESLEHKILDVFVPTQDKIEIKGGKKATVKEKIFPGYILVKMILDDDAWLAVRTTQGVTSFVGIANKPTPIPSAEVATIMKFMQGEAAPTYKQLFSDGDTVKIIEGPFAEFIGKVDGVDKERGKVKVLVSIFGRETPVELDFLQISKL